MANFEFPSLRENFGTDKTLEADGKWCVHPGTNIEVKIRRATHPEFKKTLRKEFKKVKHLGNNMPPEVEQEVKYKAAAKGMITDWKVDGVPFNAEAVLEAFRQYPDFYLWCEGESENFENYRLEEVEEDAAPLSPISSGATSGVPQTNSPSSNDALPEAS